MTGVSLSHVSGDREGGAGATLQDRKADKQLLAGVEGEVLEGAAVAASRRHGEGAGRAVLVQQLKSRPRLAVVRDSGRLPPTASGVSGAAGGSSDVANRLDDSELALPPMTMAEGDLGSAAGRASATVPSQGQPVQASAFFDEDRPFVRLELSRDGLLDDRGLGEYAGGAEDIEMTALVGDSDPVPDWLGLLPGAAASAAAGLSMHLQQQYDASS